MPDESPVSAPEDGLEHFVPTGGRITGILGLVVVGVVVVLWVVDRDNVAAPVVTGALLAGVLFWASLLRPRVSASSETLVLRNMLETIHIPLAAIDELAIRQVLAVRVGDRRFVCPAVGRKLRKLMHRPRISQLFGPTLPDLEEPAGTTSGTEKAPTDIDYADHVEQRLRHLVDEARTRHGVRPYSDQAEALAAGVRREPSWPEIGALAGTGLLFVAALFI